MRTLRALLLSFLPLALAAGAHAQDHGTEAEAHAEEEKLDALHHSADGFYLDFAPFGHIELPRVFLVRRADGGMGLDVFGSTHAAVASGRYVLDPHGHGGGHAEAAEVPAEAGAEENAADSHVADGHTSEGQEPHGVTDPEAHGDEPNVVGNDPGEEPLAAELAGPEGEATLTLEEADPLDVGIIPSEGEVIADLSVTRHTVFLFLAGGLVLLFFLPLGAKYRRGIGRETAPEGRFQNAMEALVIYVREEIAKPTMGDKHAKYMPYLLTAFFFILFSNLLGLLPFSATITSNIAVTAVLACFTFVVTQFAGTKDYWGHIFNPPGVPALVKPIMVPIEFLGIFTKPFALAIRLFANMTAGHLVILSLIGLIFAFANIFGPAVGWGTSLVSVPMTLFVYGLELLIAFIQAYVFTILSALFIGMASAEHEHHGHDSHGHDQTPHEKAVQTSALVSDRDGLYHERERTVGTESAMAFSS